MTMARRTVVPENEPGIYHCIFRYVRRAFLCGVDSYSGKDYEHRKSWVRELTGLFSLEVCTYAVMSQSPSPGSEERSAGGAGVVEGGGGEEMVPALSRGPRRKRSTRQC